MKIKNKISLKSLHNTCTIILCCAYIYGQWQRNKMKFSLKLEICNMRFTSILLWLKICQSTVLPNTPKYCTYRLPQISNLQEASSMKAKNLKIIIYPSLGGLFPVAVTLNSNRVDNGYSLYNKILHFLLTAVLKEALTLHVTLAFAYRPTYTLNCQISKLPLQNRTSKIEIQILSQALALCY